MVFEYLLLVVVILWTIPSDLNAKTSPNYTGNEICISKHYRRYGMFPAYQIAKVDHLSVKTSAGAATRDTITRERFDAAQKEIGNWEGYKKTPLISFAGLAASLDIGMIHYKHEGPRFGLGSFKALGGSYAVLLELQRELTRRKNKQVTLDAIHRGDESVGIGQITVTSATDGNHGRSVAWGAARFGARCRIYIHAEVSEHRAQVMRDLGAEVIRTEGDYDAAVAECRRDATTNGWLIVSDTSWSGYTNVPCEVMSGYGVMAREIVEDLPDGASHVFLQGGVGGLAAAVAVVFYQEWGVKSPRLIVVEPERAPCLFASAKAGKATTVPIREETIMAGLSCGEPSEIAWSILNELAGDFMTIPDSLVAPAIQLLARGVGGDTAVEAGESAVAGLCGLIISAQRSDLRQKLNIDKESVVVLIGSEGVTDPYLYQQMKSA